MERTKEFQGDSQSFQTASWLNSTFPAGGFTGISAVRFLSVERREQPNAWVNQICRFHMTGSSSEVERSQGVRGR